MPVPPRDLRGWAQAAPDRLALVIGAATRTFAQLADDAGTVVAGLRALGARPGARILWCGQNAPEIWTLVHACRIGGFVSVPLSYRATAAELRHMISVASGAVLVTDRARAAAAGEALAGLPGPPRLVVIGGADTVTGAADALSWADLLSAASGAPAKGGDTPGESSSAAILFTSGTTGLPKGALRTTFDPTFAATLTRAIGLGGDDEVHLLAGPLYHAGPLRLSFLAQDAGGTVVVLERFDPPAWIEQAASRKVTSAFLAPTMLKRVLEAAPDRSVLRALPLRCLVISGSPAPISLKRAAVDAFGAGVLYEFYGSTETGTNAVLRPAEMLTRPGSCGRALPGTDIRILDEAGQQLPAGSVGEVYVSSPMRIDRYVGTDAVLPEVDGHVSAGDVGYLDEDGYLHLVDRRNDTIVSGGVNIYPSEVEAALTSHPDVDEVAVFGVPSEEWGESVHAVVQLNPSAHTDADALAAHARRTLASFKVPSSWEFRAELPRNEAGKLLKAELKRPYWGVGAVADVINS